MYQVLHLFLCYAILRESIALKTSKEYKDVSLYWKRRVSDQYDISWLTGNRVDWIAWLQSAGALQPN
jgi:hypothetical protein